MASAWCSIQIEKVTAGAEHEGVRYDQWLVVKIGSESVTLFDMTPMVADGATAGQTGEALIAVDPHGLAKSGRREAEVIAVAFAPDGASTEARAETLAAKWTLVMTSGVPMLIGGTGVTALGRNQPGEKIAWNDATYFLVGWRSAP